MSESMTPEKPTGRAPVYVPYATLVTALDSLATHGIPSSGKIDKSLFAMSGAVRSQLLLALRYLELIDDKGYATPSLKPLVEATGDERKSLLRKIIEVKYAGVIAKGLETISAGQLEEAFRELNVDGSTLVRAIRFFVKVCQEVGIPISQRVTGKLRTTSANGRRPRRPTPVSGKRHDTSTADQNPVVVPVSGGWEDKLLDKFPAFDPAWPDDLKAKWFEGFDRLMKAKS